VTSKVTDQKKPTESKTSRFQIQKEKPLERLQADKEVKSAKRDVKQMKKAHQFKNPSTKVKRGLRYVASESLDVVAQFYDLEVIRTLKESVIKGRSNG
ncbi:CHAP domain-containing protein, partial [Streptococcus suis]